MAHEPPGGVPFPIELKHQETQTDEISEETLAGIISEMMEQGKLKKSAFKGLPIKKGDKIGYLKWFVEWRQ